MRATKGEARGRIGPVAATLLLVMLAGGWAPAAASIPSSVGSLAASPAPIDELPQLAAAPPATSSKPIAFSLFAPQPCQRAPAIAPDDVASYRETRVWGFHLAERSCAWSPGRLSPGRQEGYAEASGETAVDPPDFRNRLVDVIDTSNNNAAIAHYEYDAFNRRITKTAGTASRQTVWQGWRPVEDYDTSNPQNTPHLLARRTYGSGLDDILYLESDLDGSGNVTAKSWPLYDASGNLALLTNAAGKPLERYEYTPYGAQKILVNSTSPAVQQVRVVGGAVWVELSEAVQPGPLSSNPTFGAATPVTLFDTTANQPFGSLAASQPITAGDLALRRIVITGTLPTGFQAGDQVTLTIPAAALVDRFLNQPAQSYTLTFSWPAGDAVVADLAAPTVQRLTLRQGSLELELSVEPSLAAAAAAIQLDGAPLAWTLSGDHYTLTSTTQVPAGAHTLTVATTLTDLGGTPLAAAFSQAFTAAQAQDTQALYVAPDPQQSSASAVGNLYGYQGLPRDPETGLVYFRNRYYDPELGRFITADPKAYVDGPSMYAFERDDPANGSDPLGFAEQVMDAAERKALHEAQAKAAEEDRAKELAKARQAGNEWAKSNLPPSATEQEKRGAYRDYLVSAKHPGGPMPSQKAIKTTVDAFGPGHCDANDRGCQVGSEVGRRTERIGNWLDTGFQIVMGVLMGGAPLEGGAAASIGVAGAAADGGVLQSASYAQRTFSQTFSSGGTFAGQTVGDVAGALRSGALSPADVPVQYIVQEGNTLMLNTRSAQALEQAGIPRAQWSAVDMTGDAAAQARLAAQLQRNGLTSQGIPTVTPEP